MWDIKNYTSLITPKIALFLMQRESKGLLLAECLFEIYKGNKHNFNIRPFFITPPGKYSEMSTSDLCVSHCGFNIDDNSITVH